MSEVITAPAPTAAPLRSAPSERRADGASVNPGIREFLSFKLGSEEYGIDILRVQEIRSYEEPTRIANAPDFIKGVLNLRGLIVPVVDMRLRFQLGEARYDGLTVLIVLNLQSRIVGMVVDSVSDVITLSGEQMRAVPEFASHVPTAHLLAIGAVDDRMLLLVDIVKLMSSADMGLLND